jgi:hypothetical protein
MTNIKPCPPSSRAFRGVNFITPNIVSRIAGRLASGETAHVELAKENPPYWSQTVERNPNGGPMFGVTVKHPDGRNFDPDLSQSFSSEADARAYIASL